MVVVVVMWVGSSTVRCRLWMERNLESQHGDFGVGRTTYLVEAVPFARLCTALAGTLAGHAESQLRTTT